MGRSLVIAFLATVALLVATGLWLLTGLLLDLVRGTWTFLAGRPAPWTEYLAFLPGTRAWIEVLVVYLLVVLPLVTLAVLARGLRASRRGPARSFPRTWDARGKELAIVLTALDDEASIGAAVDEYRALPEVGPILVSDNTSSDRTAEVARSHGALVVTAEERGYGHACIVGLREALARTDAQVIVLSEGDGSFFAEDLRKLLPYLSDCDMVLGTRTNRELNRPGSQMDWFMAWGNLFLAFLVRLRYWDPAFLGAIQLTDVGCTFRALRRGALERILPELRVGGMYFSPHMILVALRNDVSIVETPIRFRERVGPSKGAGHSRRRALQIGGEMLREILLH